MVFRLAGIVGRRTGADQIGNSIEMILGDRVASEEEGPELGGVQRGQGGVIEDDASAALGYAVQNLHTQDALLPIEGFVYVVLPEHYPIHNVLAGMAGAHAVGDTGDQSRGGLEENLGLEDRVRVVKGEEGGGCLRLRLENRGTRRPRAVR